MRHYFRKERALLVRDSSCQKPDYGYWLLPAGRVEENENLEQALKREIAEELGIKVKIIKKLTEIVDPYTGDKLTSFLCLPSISVIEVSSELAEAQWFTIDEIEKTEKIHPDLRKFLIDGLKSAF